MKAPPSLHLMVRRRIAAPADRVFAAWTEPPHLQRWWGPAGVTCPSAEVHLRVGGRYRIANQLPEGAVLWIAGAFEQVDPPHRLVYTWAHEPVGPESEVSRVTVRFESHGDATEVIVVHERLRSEVSRDNHTAGWEGCLDSLAEQLGA